MPPVVENPPSVLAILVVHDAARWLRSTLAALARQTHPRLGVLAVDNASTDESPELLRSILGKGRVLRLERNVGFGAAVGRALAVPAAAEADYVLVMHDDAALAPDAVARMIEAAERVPGVGLVGAKILDARRPGVLLEIGHSSDRFGNPYSPLEEGEIDQGQYDATREVLYVSSSAMLGCSIGGVCGGRRDDRGSAPERHPTHPEGVVEPVVTPSSGVGIGGSAAAAAELRSITSLTFHSPSTRTRLSRMCWFSFETRLPSAKEATAS